MNASSLGQDVNRTGGSPMTDALRAAPYPSYLPAVEMMNVDKRIREKDGHGRAQ